MIREYGNSYQAQEKYSFSQNLRIKSNHGLPKYVQVDFVRNTSVEKDSFKMFLIQVCFLVPPAALVSVHVFLYELYIFLNKYVFIVL